MPEIIPLPGWVALKPMEEPQKAGSLFMPDSAQQELMRGTVVAVGEGEGHGQYGAPSPIPSSLTVGSVAVYKKYGDHEAEIGGQSYRLVHVENIMAVIS